MKLEALPVEYLFTLSGAAASRTPIESGPQGTRVLVNVPEGEFAGARLRGTVRGPSGDWETVRADGSAKIDVRTILITDDGAAILMTYNGLVVRAEGGPWIRTAPLFETGDARYTWLNNVQAVGVGTVQDGRISYDVYAVK